MFKKETGWLSPAGDFFPCKSYEHIYYAHKFAEEFGLSHPEKRDDELLLDSGWAKIAISSFIERGWSIQWNKFLTQIQISFLRPYFEEEVKENELSVTSASLEHWRSEVK